MTVLDLLTGSLRDLNICAATDTPDPADVQLAFDRLNDYVDFLATEGTFVSTILRTTWTLTPNVASFTVGTGGTINIDRPLSGKDIVQIGYVDTNLTPNAERSLGTPIGDEQYAAVPFKSLTAAYPAGFYYAPSVPLAMVYPLPIPTTTGLLGAIYTPVAVSEFTSLTQTIVVAQGYRRFFRNQVTIEIAGAFEKTPRPAAVQAVKECREAIQRANTKIPPDLVFDVALTGGGRTSNIYTGD